MPSTSEGRRYVDYVMAYGPLLFGHTPSGAVTGLDALARGGFVWGRRIAEEIRLAERVRRHLPRWSECASSRPEPKR